MRSRCGLFSVGPERQFHGTNAIFPRNEILPGRGTKQAGGMAVIGSKADGPLLAKVSDKADGGRLA